MSQIVRMEPPRLKSNVLALALGDNAAEVLQQLSYWLDATPKDEKHFRGGRVWIWRTYDAWHYGEFSTMSISTLKRVFSDLVDWGLVLKDEMNDLPTDRTLWWAIDYEALDRLETYLQGIFDSYEDPSPRGKDRKAYVEHMKRVGQVFKKAVSDQLGVTGSKAKATKGRSDREKPKWTIERVILTLSKVSDWNSGAGQFDTLLPENTPEITTDTSLSGDEETGQSGFRKSYKGTTRRGAARSEDDDSEDQPTGSGSGRPRDLIFDAIAQVCFGYSAETKVDKDDGARIGMVKKSLMQLDPPPTPETFPDEFREFGAWYDSQYESAARPQDAVKVKTHFKAFRVANALQEAANDDRREQTLARRQDEAARQITPEEAARRKERLEKMLAGQQN